MRRCVPTCLGVVMLVGCGAAAFGQADGQASGSGGVATLEPETPDAASMRKQLVRHIAEERRRRGLPPLRSQAGLARVARAHSVDMREHDFVAHTSPTTGTTPAERVQRAGISAWLVRENVARGYDAAAIHEGLMHSPGHRANILAEEAERIGVGVVPAPGTVPTAYLVTQLFASLAEPIDVKKARVVVRERLRQARSEAGYPDLTTPAPLMQAAEKAARRFVETSVAQDELLEDTLTPTPFPRARSLGGSVAVVLSLEQLEPGSLVGPKEARFLGLGLAQGDREDTGAHTIAIVVLHGIP